MENLCGFIMIQEVPKQKKLLHFMRKHIHNEFNTFDSHKIYMY